MKMDDFIEMLKKGGADYQVTEGCKVFVGMTEYVFNIHGDIQTIYALEWEA